MRLATKWLIIDHHQVPETGESKEQEHDDGQILNPWKYGIDGGKDVSAGGMAYMVASTLDPKNRDLSAIAVVSAVADRQDQGDKEILSRSECRDTQECSISRNCIY